MLLVTSLLAITSLAIYHSLINGLKIWQVSNRYVQEEDIALFLDKMSQDLRNAVNFSLIKFAGKENTLGFATIVNTLADTRSSQPEYISQIGRVEYEFDSLHAALLRRQANYGQAMEDEFGPSRPVVQSVKEVKFAYYVMESDRIVLKNRSNDLWPVAVLIEIRFAGKGEQDQTISKVINIPAGNRL